MSSPSDAPKRSRLRRKPKDPDKQSTLSQVGTLYKASVKQNPKIPLYLVGTFIVVLVVLNLLLHLIWSSWIYTSVIAVIFAFLITMVVFGRLAERAAYGALQGQTGATSAVLQSLKRGWFYEQEPVAMDAGGARKMQQLDGNAAVVFRAVGKPGVVLIGEGPSGLSRKLLETERKKVTRVLGAEVPVTLYRVGAGDGTTDVAKLVPQMKKLDKKLTDAEVQQVTKRLRALGGVKPPVPQGIDPRSARVDRKATRGR